MDAIAKNNTLTDKTKELNAELQQTKKEKENLQKQLEMQTNKSEIVETELKQELRNMKAKVEQTKLEFSERLEQEQSIARKKAFEAEKTS